VPKHRRCAGFTSGYGASRDSLERALSVPRRGNATNLAVTSVNAQSLWRPKRWSASPVARANSRPWGALFDGGGVPSWHQPACTAWRPRAARRQSVSTGSRQSVPSWDSPDPDHCWRPEADRGDGPVPCAPHKACRNQHRKTASARSSQGALMGLGERDPSMCKRRRRRPQRPGPSGTCFRRSRPAFLPVRARMAGWPHQSLFSFEPCRFVDAEALAHHLAC